MHALKITSIRYLWIGQLTSGAGSRLFQIGILWHLMATHPGKAGTLVALFLAASALPSLLLAKTIGAYLDKMTDPKKWIVTLDSMGAIVSLILVLLEPSDQSRFFIPWVFLTASLLSIHNACLNPSIQKAIPRVVPVTSQNLYSQSELLSETVGLFQSTQDLSALLGAVIGSTLIAKYSLDALLWWNAGSFLIGAFFTSLCRFSSAEKSKTTTPSLIGVDLDASWIDHFKPLLLGFGLVNFFLTPVLVLLNLSVLQWYSNSPQALAFTEGGLALGGIAGALSGAKIAPRIHSVVFSSGMLIFTSLLLLILPVPRITLGTASVAFVIALCIGALNVRVVSWFHWIVPENLKGRFFSTLGAWCSWCFPVGFVVFGMLSDKMGLIAAYSVQAIGLFITSIAFFKIARRYSTLSI